MIIRLKRLNPTHHRLTIVRSDGSSDSVELETRSYLTHDLIHLAFEETAGLKEGFWGRLASGASIEQLNTVDQFAHGSLPRTPSEIIEVVVGGMTGYVLGRAQVQEVFEGLEALILAYGLELPAYVSQDVLVRTRDRYRSLLGMWNSCPFEEELEFTFV